MSKKLYLTKVMLELINESRGKAIYTSLAYKEDKRRRALQILKKEGYFLQHSRFGFTRTLKQLPNEEINE